MRTKQEIFNIAYLGLMAQGFQKSVIDPTCRRKRLKCAYRGAGGLKCAIGHLIPDEKYTPYYEGVWGKDSLILRAAGIPSDLSDWIKNLQDCHDYADNAKDMKERLHSFAKYYHLYIPVGLPA